MSTTATPVVPYIAPSSGNIDQRLAQTGNELSRRIIALESRTTELESRATTLEARQNTSVLRSLVGGLPSTGSTTFVMVGLALSVVATGSATRLYVLFEGELFNNVNNGNSYAQMAYGIGTPPPPGIQMGATNGILIGNPVWLFAPQANQTMPFASASIVSNLLPGTPYWLDIAQRANPGMVQISNPQMMAFSLIDAVAPRVALQRNGLPVP